MSPENSPCNSLAPSGKNPLDSDIERIYIRDYLIATKRKWGQRDPSIQKYVFYFKPPETLDRRSYLQKRKNQKRCAFCLQKWKIKMQGVREFTGLSDVSRACIRSAVAKTWCRQLVFPIINCHSHRNLCLGQFEFARISPLPVYAHMLSLIHI